VRDLEMTYQYSNFGVPGLGLRRGLGRTSWWRVRDGPAAMVDPAAAVRNFRRLEEAGAAAPYGFYEALDYTGERIPEGESMWSCGPTWPTTRACCCWRSPTPCARTSSRLFHATRAAATSCSCGAHPRDVAVGPPARRRGAAAADARELVRSHAAIHVTHSATPRRTCCQRALRGDADARARLQPLA